MGKADKNTNKSSGGNNWSDLWVRLVSALVMAALVLVITWSGPIPFAVLLMVGGVLMCWEWGNLVRDGEIDELLILHVISVLAACGLAIFDKYSVALLLLLVGPAVKFIASGDNKAKSLGISLLGVPYIGLPLISLIWLHHSHDGWHIIFYLFAVVWSVDIFAYFSGRKFGGPKLAPAISPKKTWSGFIGGVTAGTIAGIMYSWFMGNSNMLLPVAVISLLLGAFSQIGDLFESVIKRKYKVKDASNLIPGHGGLLDRVDGLLFAAALAALIAYILDPSYPARVLIYWTGT